MKVSTFPSISFPPLQMLLVCHYVVSSFSLLPLLPHLLILFVSHCLFSLFLHASTRHTHFLYLCKCYIINCSALAILLKKCTHSDKGTKYTQCTHIVLLNSLTWDDTGCECAQIYFPHMFSCCCCCFCSFIHHAYILSDLIIHVKVSPRQLPSEASTLRW